MISIENMELRLDQIAAEALRREACRLDIAHANKDERAVAMAKVRAEVKCWRDRSTASALRDAAGSAGL